MNKVAIGFLTKDRVELSRRTVEPLFQPDKFDLFWFDGSAEERGRLLAEHTLMMEPLKGELHKGVRGGPDAAVVYALTTMLYSSNDYTHVGLVENDVLLHPDWFGSTMALFDRGKADGLEVGAVSARAYEDRILIQRDGYAVMHNLGWGMQIMTREAARLSLDHMRTSWTAENRRVFAQLVHNDIGRYWAFRAGEHWLCADWGNDRVLTQNGLASLALTPSPVEMVGQVPPLHEQGLKLVKLPVEWLRDEVRYWSYVSLMKDIRDGNIKLGHNGPIYQEDSGSRIFFPHQIGALQGQYAGDWRLKWTQGFGVFSWKAGMCQKDDFHAPTFNPMLTVPVSGPCQFLVSGGKDGGQVRIVDEFSNYEIEPVLGPETDQGLVSQIVVPAGVSYRNVTLTALTPGIVFYGLKTQEPQPTVPFRFDHSVLPPV